MRGGVGRAGGGGGRKDVAGWPGGCTLTAVLTAD